MKKYRVLKPTSISKGILPVAKEVLPGDFGLSESQLDEMVKKDVMEEIKPARKKETVKEYSDDE